LVWLVLKGGRVELGTSEETLRIGQILGIGQQVRVCPHGVPSLHAASVPDRRPEVRRLPELARAQLQPDQGGEGLLRRATARAAPAYRLGQRPGRRQTVTRGRGHDVVNPAFDEGESVLEARQRGLLPGRRGHVEQPAL
jgi:hypothetical protein